MPALSTEVRVIQSMGTVISAHDYFIFYFFLFLTDAISELFQQELQLIGKRSVFPAFQRRTETLAPRRRPVDPP